jgi:purine-binding chemotaxis protein CheW
MNANQLLVFNLGAEEYGIDIKYTKEIIRIPKLIKIPNVPDFIEGVFELRGTIITVVDLKKRFQLLQSENGLESRLLILDMEGQNIGIIVDDISEVLNTYNLTVQKLESELTGFIKNSIDGVTVIEHRLILLLNMLQLKNDIFKLIEKRI